MAVEKARFVTFVAFIQHLGVGDDGLLSLLNSSGQHAYISRCSNFCVDNEITNDCFIPLHMRTE